MDTIKNTWNKKPMVIVLSGILILAIILLLVVVVLQAVVFRNNDETATATVSVAQATETVESMQTGTAQAMDNTPTPTQVVKQATATPPPVDTATPTPKPTKLPTATPTPTDTPEPEMVNVVRNGGFEWGFGDDGVADQWKHFTNESAKYIFAAEVWPPAIRNGEQAQRITIFEASQSNRYAGIYQIVPVVPGEAYRLTLHGQIRSRAGDIAVSRYGYRMQYAVDWAGDTDWQAIPEDAWVELPWDEQLLDGSAVKFLDYSTSLTPPNSRLTLFVRAWSKWADPVEAQYTLDTLSLVGPKPAEDLLDQPLPDTGGTALSLPTDPRIWGGLALLIFLIGGAAWRAREAANQRMM